MGTAVAALVLMYVLVAVVLLGCEFNAEYERERSGAARNVRSGG